MVVYLIFYIYQSVMNNLITRTKFINITTTLVSRSIEIDTGGRVICFERSFVYPCFYIRIDLPETRRILFYSVLLYEIQITVCDNDRHMLIFSPLARICEDIASKIHTDLYLNHALSEWTLFSVRSSFTPIT